MSVAFMIVACFHYYFGLPAKLDPLKVVKSWQQPVNAISKVVPKADFILTDKYELAGELAFYWPHRLPVYITGSKTRRFNQHDLWPAIDREAGRDAVYISTHPAAPPELDRAFTQCVEYPPVIARGRDGRPLRTLYVRHCMHYASIIWPTPQFY
jgi:hypothetical protein